MLSEILGLKIAPQRGPFLATLPSYLQISPTAAGILWYGRPFCTANVLWKYDASRIQHMACCCSSALNQSQIGLKLPVNTDTANYKNVAQARDGYGRFLDNGP